MTPAIVQHLGGRGIYTIVLRISPVSQVEVGRLGTFEFHGLYAYTGSALGKGSSSLGGRITRHISSAKALRWHIDYLLVHSNVSVTCIVVSATSDKSKECKVSQGILDRACFTGGIKRFGSSDCSCKSHLAHLVENRSEALEIVLKAHRGAGLKPKILVKP